MSPVKKWHNFPKVFVVNISDLKLWTKSYAWQKVNELVQYSDSDMDTYYTRASENSSADLNENYIESYERRNQSFEYLIILSRNHLGYGRSAKQN